MKARVREKRVNPNLQHLRAGRGAAYALFQATWNNNQNEAREAAACLLEMAVYATSLVEDSALVHPDAFRNASRDYRYFPLLLASKNGRDTKQKLCRVGSLPIGEHQPFKRLCGQARNDNLRYWIENTYDVFQRIRRGEMHLVDPVDPVLAKDICRLPGLTKDAARQWAAVLARYTLGGPGGAKWPDAFGIDLSRETKRRRHRKEATFRKTYEGSKQLDGAPQAWSLKHKHNLVPDRLRPIDGSKPISFSSFVVQDKSGAQGRELDSTEAMKFAPRREKMEHTAPTDADQVNALTDAIQKRLQAILRY